MREREEEREKERSIPFINLVTDCSNLAALLVGVMKRGGLEADRVREEGME